MSDINLLPKSDATTLKQDRSIALFRKLAITVLSLTAFTSVAIFILVLLSPLSKAQQEEKNLITQLSNSSNRIGRNSIIYERLTTITNILQTRHTFEEVFDGVIRVLPPEIDINRMNISAQTLLITGETTSVEAANEFFASLIAYQEKKEHFSDISLNSFSLQTGSGTYNFILELTLL